MATLTPDAASAAGPESIDAAPGDDAVLTQLALAKLNLMEAGRAIRPLDPLRQHPWTTVGVAAGAGVVLGSLGGGGGKGKHGGGGGGGLAALVGSLTGLVRALSGVMGPLMSIIGPLVAGKVAAATTKDDAAEAVVNAQATGDPDVPPSAVA